MVDYSSVGDIGDAVNAAGVGTVSPDLNVYRIPRDRRGPILSGDGTKFVARVDYKGIEGLTIKGDLETAKRFLKEGESYDDTGEVFVSKDDAKLYSDAVAELDRVYREEVAAVDVRLEQGVERVVRAKYPEGRLTEGLESELARELRNSRFIFPNGGISDYEPIKGIQVDAYGENAGDSALVNSITIAYTDPLAVMNVDSLKKHGIEFSESELLQAMNGLKDKHQVETGYLHGEVLQFWSTPRGIGDTSHRMGRRPEHRQNNVFQVTLSGEEITAKAVTSAVSRVYQTGEAFKAGVQTLLERKKAQEAAAAAVVKQESADKLSFFN